MAKKKKDVKVYGNSIENALNSLSNGIVNEDVKKIKAKKIINNNDTTIYYLNVKKNSKKSKKER